MGGCAALSFSGLVYGVESFGFALFAKGTIYIPLEVLEMSGTSSAFGFCSDWPLAISA